MLSEGGENKCLLKLKTVAVGTWFESVEAEVTELRNFSRFNFDLNFTPLQQKTRDTADSFNLCFD
jgi:hypothetical protein